MSLLDSAVLLQDHGWFIFPCGVESKQPDPFAAPHGLNSSSNDLAQIDRWWKVANPRFNIGIDLGRSGLTVLDVDQGFPDIEAAREWFTKMRFPRTYMVRTGRRDSFGIQLYFKGLAPNHPYNYGLISGEIRSRGYYVLGEGSIHPISKEPYTVLVDQAPAELPPIILELTKEKAPRPQGSETKRVPASWRHYFLIERGRELHFAGLAGSELEHALRWLYDKRCVHDPAKDARIADNEILDIVKWIHEHPPEYPLEPGDFIKLRFAEKDEKVRAA
jgi:Bifunctional DNA primase/polymerase, N-terminal